jgi:hypothetical protein
MKTYGGVDVLTHSSLTSALARGEWSASWPGRFTSGKRAPDTHWIGDLVGPRAGLDDMKKSKFLPHRDSNSDPMVVQPVARRYTNCAIPALLCVLYSHENVKIRLHVPF